MMMMMMMMMTLNAAELTRVALSIARNGYLTSTGQVADSTCVYVHPY